MDIDLLSKIVKELILDNDEVTLPGVGSFVAELVPSVFSDKGYTINPPYKRLSFRQKEADNGSLLISFYAKCNNLDMETASKIMHEFLKEMRHILEVKKTILFPGLGKLRATRENCFFFVADEDLDIYPEGFGLEPISLKTHEETPAEVSVTMAALRSILGGEDEAEEKAGKVNADSTAAAAGNKTAVKNGESITEKAGSKASGDAGAADRPMTAAETETGEKTLKETPEAGATTDIATQTATEKAGETAEKDGESGITDTAESCGQERTSVDAEQTESHGAAAEEETEERKETPTGLTAATLGIETSEDSIGKAGEPAADVKAAVVSEKAAETEAAEKTRKENPIEQAEETAEGSKAFTGTVALSMAAKADAEKTEEQTADGMKAEKAEKAADGKKEVSEKAVKTGESVIAEAIASRENEEEKTAETVDIEKPEPSTEKVDGTAADSKAAQATEKPKKTGWKILKWAIITVLIIAVTALAAFIILAHTAPDFIDSILYTPEELEILNM